MKKAVQTIRVIAIIVGLYVMVFGIIGHIWSYLVYAQQSNVGFNTNLAYYFWSNVIVGAATSISSGIVPILLALFINPDKVAPIFEKVFSSSKEVFETPENENVE